MHCHGKFLLNVCSLWKYRSITVKTVRLTWKKKNNYEPCASFDKAVTSRHSQVPEMWGLLTHVPVSWGITVTRMKWSIWLPCEMCHLVHAVEIETSVCLPTIPWTLALKWHFFSHLKCSFILQWLHWLAAQIWEKGVPNQSRSWKSADNPHIQSHDGPLALGAWFQPSWANFFPLALHSPIANARGYLRTSTKWKTSGKCPLCVQAARRHWGFKATQEQSFSILIHPYISPRELVKMHILNL